MKEDEQKQKLETEPTKESTRKGRCCPKEWAHRVGGSQRSRNRVSWPQVGLANLLAGLREDGTPKMGWRSSRINNY